MIFEEEKKIGMFQAGYIFPLQILPLHGRLPPIKGGRRWEIRGPKEHVSLEYRPSVAVKEAGDGQLVHTPKEYASLEY